MNVFDAMRNRRSIRKYTDEPVTKADITTLLEAAMVAPSARNTQPWEFVVVDDPEKLAVIRNEFANMNYEAPLAIIVCGVLDSNVKKTYWAIDCALASSNILHAAVGLGLGTVWCALYPREKRMARVHELLSIPEGIEPLNAIYIGHPDESPAARSHYDENRVYWNNYGER